MNYDGITELQKDRQGKAPTFSKRGYNYEENRHYESVVTINTISSHVNLTLRRANKDMDFFFNI